MSQQNRLNDELLVLRCQEGDAEAFELLVGRWQGRLWRHAWRLTGDENAAWDAVQETWVGISRGIVRRADAAAFPAWAYQNRSDSGSMSFTRLRKPLCSGCRSSAGRGLAVTASAVGAAGGEGTFSSRKRGQ